MAIITIMDKQYNTTKETIKRIYGDNGFKVTFKTESIKGKFRAGYYLIKVSHSFRCFADKLKGSIKIKEQLNKLEVL